jgi:hypothetical protein
VEEKTRLWNQLMTPVHEKPIVQGDHYVKGPVVLTEVYDTFCHACDFPHLRHNEEDDTIELVIKLDKELVARESQGYHFVGYSQVFFNKCYQALKELKLETRYTITTANKRTLRLREWLNVVGKKRDLMGRIVFENTYDRLRCLDHILIIKVTEIPQDVEGSDVNPDEHK